MAAAAFDGIRKDILLRRFRAFLIITVCLLLVAGVTASVWLAYDARQQASETKSDVAALSADIAAAQGTIDYFSSLPSQVGGLPKSDSYCAANVTSSNWEPRPDNYTANHSVPSSLSLIPWGSEMNYWVRWFANRSLVTGNYRGTTNQIIQWAACKWGIDENLLRAVSVQESDWHESMVGDSCGSVGEASYGLFQIKNKYCNGSWAWGGYDYSAKNSAFNADFYAAYIRSCLDNDFYDGGSWLYGGRTIAQIISTNGFDDAVWGCVGSWFSGSWYDSGARSYISSVQSHLANKDWLKY